MKQLERQVGWRGAKDVGHQQDAVAVIDQVQHLAGERQQVERIVLGGQAQLVQLQRPLVSASAGVLDERLAVAAMRDEKDDHAPDSNRSD